jgi:hypothetical protein
MLLQRLVFAALLGFAAPVAAETTIKTPVAEVEAADLGAALQLDALFDVLREEGLAYGASLQADMFPGGGGAEWQDDLDRIYNVTALRGRFDAVLARGLDGAPEHKAAILAFFASDLGSRVIRLEIEARRTMLDEAAEDAARVAADKRATGRDPLQPLILRFIEASDLIEMNVAGSLSGTLAFLTGLSDAGLYGQPLPLEDLMSQVWSQEEQIRSDTSSWLYAFLGLAYAPLPQEDLERYIEFWASPAGEHLNAALFAAFDEMFRDVSYQLGRAAGAAIQGRDI